VCGFMLSIGPEADPAIFRRMLEHARDLVGAARWNATPVMRRLVYPRRNRGDEAPLPG
jgi:hypothetical protein